MTPGGGNFTQILNSVGYILGVAQLAPSTMTKPFLMQIAEIMHKHWKAGHLHCHSNLTHQHWGQITLYL